MAVALQPVLLVPILVTGVALGGLPLLLITTLALIAVYAPERFEALTRHQQKLSLSCDD